MSGYRVVMLVIAVACLLEKAMPWCHRTLYCGSALGSHVVPAFLGLAVCTCGLVKTFAGCKLF